VILFLQGPPSSFWSELAEAFEQAGARTLRIRLSASDHLYWRRRGAISYRGRLADWPAFLSRLIVAEGITDIVYYADRPPYHAAAAEVGERLGVRCHTVENGYLRPDWITLERDGMGVHSRFPDDAATLRRLAAGLPEADLSVRYRHSFGELAANEVINDLLNYFGLPFYPHYRSDRYYNPLVDYLAWLPRCLHIGAARRAAREVAAWDPSVRFWLLAMQLQADYQIRANSHYRHLSEMLDEVLTSFAAHAAPGDRFVVKLHPHDNGLERWDRVIARLSDRLGLGDRVRLIDGGDLGHLLERCRGVVLVNSTVGLHTLRALRPLKILGAAIYDIAGLTHRGSLDDFWTRPQPVDGDLVDAFVRVLAATIQIKGDFYDPAGRRAAITEIVARILEDRVNQPGALMPTQPRLAAFEAAGGSRGELARGPARPG
jgi:capsular polysaccharide export protein